MVDKKILGSEDVELLRNRIEQILKTCSMDKDELTYKEKELQDLLHEIEFTDCCDSAYYEAFILKIQQHRRERRRLKDEILIMEPVAEMIKTKYPALLNDLNKVLGKCRNNEERIRNRTYTPRTTLLKELLELREERQEA